MIYRIYTEKKEGFAAEAGALLSELRQLLHMTGLKDVRLLSRYDVEGLDAGLFERCIPTVFSEPQTDRTFSRLPEDADEVFAVEYLPGQFDQRADSCAQCIQFVSGGDRPTVRTATVYLLYGALSPEELEAVKSYVINPVESREASLELPDTLDIPYAAPEDVEVLTGFLEMNGEGRKEFASEYGLAMDQADLAFCQEYFRKEGRQPTLTEVRMIDTYWSDHCRHTTFSTVLDEVEIHDETVKKGYDRYLEVRRQLGRKKPVTLMDMATLGAKYLKAEGLLESLDESEEINACTVKIKVHVDGKEEDWLFLFKNETHNHPTEIEPFGGAATCVGGAIRDPLSGRSYVYQAMRVTGAGDPTAPMEDTLAGKLPQRTIVTTAAAGYSSYGNQIGLTTGLVDEIYHPGYVAKRMEIGAVVGAAPRENVRREAPSPGDLVVLLGGRTGRDGCGGATGSSKSHDITSLSSCGAEVQKGNAPEERKLQRLFRNPEAARMIKRCNDFGAGGVSVAIGELADGLLIDLDKVPKKYEGLDGTELAISESQERMAVVLREEDRDAFFALAAGENLEATVVATVQKEPRLVMKWRGKTIVDVSREFLNSNGAEKHAEARVNPFPRFEQAGVFAVSSDGGVKGTSVKYGSAGDCSGGCCGVSPQAMGGGGRGAASGTGSFEGRFQSLAGDLNVCSKRGLSERFDSTIGAATVLMPFGGKRQRTPAQSMAAKIPLLKGETTTCSLMAYGYNPYISEKNQYAGAYLAVVESVAKLVASGGDLSRCWLSFQEYFEKLGEDPQRWGKPVAALLGALNAQLDLSLAAIGGKDSMSGSFEDLHVPPTLVSFAASMGHLSHITSPEFKEAGSDVLLLAPDYETNGLPRGAVLRQFFDKVSCLLKEGRVISCYTPGFGGVAEGIMKMSFGNRVGFAFDDAFDPDTAFSYCYGGFLVELSRKGDEGEIAREIGGLGTVRLVGRTLSEYAIRWCNETVSLEKLEEIYEGRLESVFPCNLRTESSEIPLISWEERAKGCAVKIGATKPRVLIPVFPGTNCEYDTGRAFEEAGASVSVAIIRNLTPGDLAESMEMMRDEISRSQIILIPGGFSGGDEPDGSGKFITSFFRNPALTEAVHELLQKRDGLMAGICNGFQALIKLGLLPYGEIRDMDETCPTLTYNRIGRHQSKLVQTRVASVKSPWLSGCNVGDIHTVAISHGEGRFVCEASLLTALADGGQIATQYVDPSGRPTMDIQYNPNGSVYAVEGITSPDGRVFGKMGHTERMRPGLYKNVCEAKGNGMFQSAVDYFKI